MPLAFVAIVLTAAVFTWQPRTAEREMAHDKLDFFVGEWTAEFTVDLRGDVSPVKFSAEARFKWALNDTWLQYEFSGELPGRGTVAVLTMINYLPSKRTYVYYLFDRSGGEAGVFYGDWIDEDTIVFNAKFDVDDKPTAYQRITWTKLPEGKLGFVLGFSRDGKDFNNSIRGVYTRAEP